MRSCGFKIWYCKKTAYVLFSSFGFINVTFLSLIHVALMRKRLIGSVLWRHVVVVAPWCSVVLWCRGVVIITTTQLHSTKPEFCAGSNPARSLSEIRDGKDLWQWSRLEARPNAFRRSTIPQKQFIIITIIIGSIRTNWRSIPYLVRQSYCH